MLLRYGTLEFALSCCVLTVAIDVPTVCVSAMQKRVKLLRALVG
jgi:hypothetical protein